MPMPWSYRHATKDWQAFLADAQDQLGTPTDHTTYTAVQGVLLTFRRRLSVAQGLAFAQVLPAVLRAIFIDSWDTDAAPRPFDSREVLEAEARSLRPHHNLTPDAPIAGVAWALRRAVDQAQLDRVLARLPAGAAAFWAVEVDDPAELERRIV